MFDWLVAIVTLPRVIAFVLGMLVCQAIGWYVSHRRVKAGKPPKTSTWNAVVGVVVVVTMLWIMVSTQQARNCAISLNVAVAEEQSIAKVERDAFQRAITESFQIPPDVIGLPQNDPRRKVYTDPIQARYLAETKRAAAMREANAQNQRQAQEACGT